VGLLTNVAGVWAASPLDPAPGNNWASICTTNVHPAFTIVPATVFLVAESGPVDGGIEVGETVTVCFYLKNVGSASTTNLVATLLPSGGVLSPQGPLHYGAVEANGPVVGRSAAFTAGSMSSGVITATLQLQEGPLNLGAVSFDFALNGMATLSNPSVVPIPEGGAATVYPSTIQVSGLNGVVGKVTATLSNLHHAYLVDLDILLVGPGGQAVMLMSDIGDANVSQLDLTFDDAAASRLPRLYGPVVTGCYKPADYEPGDALPPPAPPPPYGTNLALFNGASPNGTWSLYVADDYLFDGGAIEGGWSLTLATHGQVNPPPALWALGTMSANGPVAFVLRGRVGDTWQIDASTNLLNWTPLCTNTLATNALWFVDPSGTNSGCRFYRAAWRP
jgi:subtilisin-like proprotein convertase family protein